MYIYYNISTFIRFSIEQGLREYIYKFIMLFLNEYKTCSLLCFPAPERRVDESYFLLRLVRLDLSKKKKCQRASLHACMRVRAWATFSGSSLDHPVQTSFFLKKTNNSACFYISQVRWRRIRNHASHYTDLLCRHRSSQSVKL